MLLENKNAVIYGGGGGIGTGVALSFAREGARVFLAGRTQAKLDAAVAKVKAAGGKAEAAVVDAMDEKAVEAYVESVAKKAGSVDVSFNLVTRGDVQGQPLIETSAADYAAAVTNGLLANFITAKVAAKRMVAQKSGVILMLTSGSSSAPIPMMGSTPPADAAIEALMRCLAAEVGPQGVRVLGMWTAGVPETLSIEKINAVNSEMQMDEAGFQQMLAGMAQMPMLKRMPDLARVADTAAFLASDRAGAITATIVNVTCGLANG